MRGLSSPCPSGALTGRIQVLNACLRDCALRNVECWWWAFGLVTASVRRVSWRRSIRNSYPSNVDASTSSRSVAVILAAARADAAFGRAHWHRQHNLRAADDGLDFRRVIRAVVGGDAHSMSGSQASRRSRRPAGSPLLVRPWPLPHPAAGLGDFHGAHPSVGAAPHRLSATAPRRAPLWQTVAANRRWVTTSGGPPRRRKPEQVGNGVGVRIGIRIRRRGRPRTRPDRVLCDKAYSSRPSELSCADAVSRPPFHNGLTSRPPEPDEAARAGGHPSSIPRPTKAATLSSAASTSSNSFAPWPPATTNASTSSMAPSTSPRSESGSAIPSYDPQDTV